MESRMKKKLVIIDGQSLAKEIFYHIPNFYNGINGKENSVYGFLQCIFYIIEKENPTHLLVVFDDVLDTDCINKLPVSYDKQVKQIKEVLNLVKIFTVDAEEAKTADYIASVSSQKNEGWDDILIFTNDKRMLQIVSEKIRVACYSLVNENNDFEIYSQNDVVEKYGIEPRLIPDLYGLLACKGQGENGSIGAHTASKLLKEYGSFNALMDNVDTIASIRVKNRINEFMESGKEVQRCALLDESKQITIDIEKMASIEQIRGDIVENLQKDVAHVIENEINMEQCDIHTILRDTKDFFVKVRNWNEVENIFLQVASAGKEQKEIGFYFLVEDEWIHQLFYKEDCYVEQSGQLSLFESVDKVKEKFLLAIAITVQETTYYVDCEKEWFCEDKFVLQLYHWLENNLSLCVLDGKRFLYTANALFEEYHLNTQILNYHVMQNFRDLSIAKYLLAPMQDSYLYEDFGKEYLNIELPSVKEVLEKKNWRQCKKEKEEAVMAYCCYQSNIAEILSKILIEQLEKSEMLPLYQNVEMPLLYVLFQMEQRGIRVNRESLIQFGTSLVSRIKELEEKIYKQAGENFNINSPKQLGTILFEKMNLPNGKKTKTGYSTSAEVLENLKEDYAIVKDILEYRQVSKLKSTYADGLLEYISPQDGRIHGKFNQTVTATGRLSSTEPNLQNIPIRMELGREIRKVFIPKDGFVFLDADYSQIELRVLAHMSGDESLIRAYNTGKDIHRITASEVFHTPFEEVTAQQRSNAKAVNFGIVYGISSFGLGQDLNITRKEAQEYIEGYFSTYPGIKKYLDESVELGRKNGYVCSLMGRRRPVPELLSKNFNQRSFGERVAMNSPIQGTAADIIKLAMIRVNDRIRKERLRSQLLLQIHDELLVETHVEEIDIVKKILEEEMDQVVQLAVPLEIDVKQGNNWNEAH